MTEIGPAGNRSLTTYDCLEFDFIFSSSVRRRYIWHIYIGSVIIMCSDNRYIVCPITKKQRSVTHKTKGATVRHLTTTKHKICKSYIYIYHIYIYDVCNTHSFSFWPGYHDGWRSAQSFQEDYSRCRLDGCSDSTHGWRKGEKQILFKFIHL